MSSLTTARLFQQHQILERSARDGRHGRLIRVMSISGGGGRALSGIRTIPFPLYRKDYYGMLAEMGSVTDQPEHADEPGTHGRGN